MGKTKGGIVFLLSLMPYGQKMRKMNISIDIDALRAKEKIKFKQFLIISSYRDIGILWGVRVFP